MPGADEASAAWPLALFIGLSVLGLIGLLLPLPDGGAGLRLALNLAHLPLFALWSGLLLRLHLESRGPDRALAECSAIGLLVAVGSEAAQALQPSREVDLRDVFSNLSGVGLGLAIVRWRWHAKFAKA